jgi:hypothetical protein
VNQNQTGSERGDLGAFCGEIGKRLPAESSACVSQTDDQQRRLLREFGQ